LSIGKFQVETATEDAKLKARYLAVNCSDDYKALCLSSWIIRYSFAQICLDVFGNALPSLWKTSVVWAISAVFSSAARGHPANKN
jgi:hypothetical protein